MIIIKLLIATLISIVLTMICTYFQDRCDKKIFDKIKDVLLYADFCCIGLLLSAIIFTILKWSIY